MPSSVGFGFAFPTARGIKTASLWPTKPRFDHLWRGRRKLLLGIGQDRYRQGRSGWL